MPPRPPLSPRRWPWTGPAAVAAVALLSTVAAGCGGASGGHAANPTTSPTTAAAATSSGSSPAVALQDAYVSVIDRVRPSVVEIATSTDLGSGIVLDGNGDIVTNHHVVGSASHFTVTFFNGRSTSASLVGSYAPDDLAVVKVAKLPSGVRSASFGDSRSLKIGDIVLAIGNPLGLASSVTQGIVSYNGRTVTEPNNVVLPATIQTSASINPGNSGGALVDLAGQVVGIPTLAATDQQLGGGAAPGIGFAIPSNTITMIAHQLVKDGKVTHSGRAALGVEVTDGYSPSGQPIGAVVVAETSGGPAATAGIPVGSLITAVNGTTVTSTADLEVALASLSPGQKVTISYTERNGATKKATVTLGQLPGSK